MTIQLHKIALVSAAMVVMVLIIGCDRDQSDTRSSTSTAPTVGEQAKAAAERTGEVLDSAARKTGEVLKDATDATTSAAAKVATELRAATRPTTQPLVN